MTTAPEKCVILVPVGHSIESACEEGLRELERRGYPVRRIKGYSAIDQARCQIATDVLAEEFEETMWIDSDIGFHPDDVERLRSHSLPFVCGLYPQKGKRALACHVKPGTGAVTFGHEGGLLEVKYSGFGFMLVHRTVYQQIQKDTQLPNCNLQFGRPLIPFFLPLVVRERFGDPNAPDRPTTHWYLPEDFAFCERARRCGINLWADTRIRLKHIGNYAYSWEDAGAELPRFDSFSLRISGGQIIRQESPEIK